MQRSDTNCTWLSAHLFFEEHVYGEVCDRVILKVIEPFVRHCQKQDWIDRYFFMRYSKRGPHARFRLFGKRETIEQTVRPALIEHVGRTFPHELKAEPQRLPDDPEPPEGAFSLLFIPYEPETDRYGGPEGVKLAEQFFQHSSEASLAILKKSLGGERSAKLGQGLLAMVVTLYVFCERREKAATLAHRYGTAYLKALAQDDEHEASWQEAFDAGYDRQAETLGAYVDAAWERLEAGEPLSEMLDPYYEDLCKVRERFAELLSERRLIKNEIVLAHWDQAVSLIVPSYLHMTNNRLGIPIPEESYLSHLIARTLRQPEEQVVSS